MTAAIAGDSMLQGLLAIPFMLALVWLAMQVFRWASPQAPEGTTDPDAPEERRWRPVRRIYSRDGKSLYLTRFELLPPTRWGQLYLHAFSRPDEDPHPHDHPWEFWTLPLNRSYTEDVLREDGSAQRQVVRRGSWQHRHADHRHRVHSWTGRGKERLWTLVWRSAAHRNWAFIVRGEDLNAFTRDTGRAPRVLGVVCLTRPEGPLYRLMWEDYLTWRSHQG